MAQVSSACTKRVLSMLQDATGLAYTVPAIAEREGVPLRAVGPQQVTARNIPADVAEKTIGVIYPAVQVYCEKITNKLREKFRTFSGTVKMAVDVRVSRDRLEPLERDLSLYVEAVTEVLDAHRGDWGQGMFYAGGYEVSFGAAKQGGKNFIQTAKVTFDVEVSIY
ncbi:MAG: hypothetical protein ABFD60_03230 [Bryobacteraceae bacterium]